MAKKQTAKKTEPKRKFGDAIATQEDGRAARVRHWDNLIPATAKTLEENREMGRKAAATNKANTAKRRTIAEMVKCVLNAKSNKAIIKEQAEKIGLTVEDATVTLELITNVVNALKNGETTLDDLLKLQKLLGEEVVEAPKEIFTLNIIPIGSQAEAIDGED